MTPDLPPAGAAWLLRHFARWSEELDGDLLEQYRRGRSDDWYWRQALTAVGITRTREALIFPAGFVALYLAAHRLPLPGTNPPAVRLLATWSPGSGFVAFDLLTGGNFARATVLALGVLPFIVAAFVVYGGTFAVRLVTGRTLPHIVTGTRLLAVIVASAQAYGLTRYLEVQSTAAGVARMVPQPGTMFEIAAVAALTGGFAVLMAAADYVTLRRYGNGMLLAFLAALTSGLFDGFPSRPGLVTVAGLPRDAVFPLAAVLIIAIVIARAHSRALYHSGARPG